MLIAASSDSVASAPVGGVDLSYRIVIVNHDVQSGHELRDLLAVEGFDVEWVTSVASLRALVEDGSLDLVVLSRHLGGEDMLAVTRHLREHSELAIILVGSMCAPADRAIGLEVGADDYVTVPFERCEVLARVRSVLRRVRHRREGQPRRSVATFGDWRFEPIKRELTSAGGEAVVLTLAEMSLLVALISDPEHVISRDRLLEQVAGRVWGPDDRTIDQHVSHLRHKLEEQPKDPRMIKTVRGRGYLFAVRVMWE